MHDGLLGGSNGAIARAGDPGGRPAAASGGGVVVRLKGRLDMTTTSRLGRELNEALHARPPSIVVDLADLSSLDPVGSGLLVDACRMAARQGCTLILRHPGDEVRSMLRRSGLDRL